ncbi:PCI-domain-containing protein, partial [Rozella allomycis CSF55]
QAVALNSLLRNYLHFNLYDQASKLVEKTAFPTKADNNQFVRYLYYVGRIKAIELEYTQSHSHLSQAIRKAPQSPNTAGFLQAANKLSIIVQLLMGEIPERSLFRQKLVSKSLIPYLHLTRAVRVGDLAAFQDVLQKYMNTFKNDKTYTLILRLRHNVIKTAVRMISLSYSRISLKDVAQKLLLNSEEDAEFIVAKTIRDGVIDASIDHIGRFMKSKENVDVYSTNEPQLAFHQRIAFCLSSYNDSVKSLKKAMRFPDNEHKKKLEDVLELEREQEKELKDIEDMDEDYEME